MPVNSELFRAIADVIEQNPDKYDQHDFGFNDDDFIDVSKCHYIPANQAHTCGTPHCIAGWAVALTPVEKRPEGLDVGEAATVLLGLDDDESGYLFWHKWCPPKGVTVPEQLRRIADSGNIFDGE